MTDDVLLRLRTATAEDHERVERALDLMDASLDRGRLVRAMTVLHGFWGAAEAGLDAWAAAHPADAVRLRWPTRRRADLYAGDLHALGSTPAEAAAPLPALRGTEEALGRMYVLEGSTLGGTSIARHLAGRPDLSGIRLRAFSPYGQRTGEMWAAFRRVTREHVAAGGDPDRVVDAACDTFAALCDWVTSRSATRGTRASADLWTRL